MKRWKLRQGKLREDPDGEWVAAAEVADLEAEVTRLQAVRVAAIHLYETCWMLAGSSLELAVHYGPDFVPPDEKDLNRAADNLRDALQAAEAAQDVPKPDPETAESEGHDET